MDLPVYMTAEEVAEVLRVPADNVRNLALTNKIPAIKIGNLWRFDKAKVFKYIEKKYKNDYFEI